MRPEPDRIPLTVVGGYLGAGKTTLLNHLLRHPDGRRIGVVVNDFGSIGVDVELLSGATAGGAPIVSLPNGCVCCTIGSGLHDALAALVASDPRPDHIVIEVSGVADPAAAAAWASVPPFEPAGIVVLAAADSVRSTGSDRFVGGEVVRQLAGADLIVVTKADLCTADELREAERWMDAISGGVPRVAAAHGDVPTSLALGPGPARSDGAPHGHRHLGHADRYVSWDWVSDSPVPRTALDDFLEELPVGVLRLKGWMQLDDATRVVVQRVGDRSSVSSTAEAPGDAACALVAIAVTDLVDPDALTILARTHFR